MMYHNFSALRIALVHDWLAVLRGGERVLDQLAALFPHADLYTLIHIPGATTSRIDGLRIVPSWLSRLPRVSRHYRKLWPFFPATIDRFELQGYDLVISNSHSFAKGVRVAAPTIHICYCHTPIRYVWSHQKQYFRNRLVRSLSKPAVAWLKRWDRRTSSTQRINDVLCNSRYIADRIKRAWDRDANVVYPGIDTARFDAGRSKRDDFFLMVGGFVPYKAEDVAVHAFRQLRESLIVVGDGPTRRQVEASAPANVKFVGRVPDRVLEDLYSRCSAVIYPQEEDFGMVAVEAQASGAPVIAFARGGALETVIAANSTSGKQPTGLFFHEQSPEALAAAVGVFKKAQHEFDPASLRANAERFSVEIFRDRFVQEVDRIVAGARST